jgi:hypothetical protein
MLHPYDDMKNIHITLTTLSFLTLRYPDQLSGQIDCAADPAIFCTAACRMR